MEALGASPPVAAVSQLVSGSRWRRRRARRSGTGADGGRIGLRLCGSGEHRDAYDAATYYLRAYHSNPDDEGLWDSILTNLDAYLWLVQRDHLDAVVEAGASGPQALPVTDRKVI